MKARKAWLLGRWERLEPRSVSGCSDSVVAGSVMPAMIAPRPHGAQAGGGAAASSGGRTLARVSADETRIDPHTHSAVSDGTDTPAGVLRAAAAAGVDVVGLTDHDTVRGWDEAVAAVAETGVALLRGAEIS